MKIFRTLAITSAPRSTICSIRTDGDRCIPLPARHRYQFLKGTP